MCHPYIETATALSDKYQVDVADLYLALYGWGGGVRTGLGGNPFPTYPSMKHCQR